jgi:hypothetical protein
MADTFGQYGLHEDAAEGPAILTTAVVSRVSQVLAPVPQSDSDLAIQLSAFFRVLHDAYFSSLEEIDNINEAQEVALDRARGVSASVVRPALKAESSCGMCRFSSLTSARICTTYGGRRTITE